MSIPINITCVPCHMRRLTKILGPLGTDEQLTAFVKKWMAMVSQYGPEVDSAICGYDTDLLIEKVYGVNPADLVAEDRRRANQFALERVDRLREMVEESDDPVYAGLQCAILGNYLDFSALMGQVSFDRMDDMLEKMKDFQLDRETVARFTKELETGKKLLILTDNAGEIGFDRVFAQVIRKLYPHLEIVFCVRGGYWYNDATREDARAVELEFPVIDNGNAVGGTVIELLGPEAKEAFDTADVILSKGMGNTETLYGCGKNIYYAFLVKCQRLAEVFQAPLMQAIFAKENRQLTMEN